MVPKCWKTSDILPAWVLKDCMNIIAHPLCYMINTFISENKFPTHLKQGFVPIFKKKGDRGSVQLPTYINYPVLAKVFEKILQQQMIDYLDKNRIRSSLQFGFRKLFSTTDALLFATGRKLMQTKMLLLPSLIYLKHLIRYRTKFYLKNYRT